MEKERRFVEELERKLKAEGQEHVWETLLHCAKDGTMAFDPNDQNNWGPKGQTTKL